jgi:bifunctional ADP-heptose synthase (sugar kinase/adenylyltransferase)
MVVGSDWKGKEIVGGQYSKEIVYFNRIGDYSTTNILSNERK